MKEEKIPLRKRDKQDISNIYYITQQLRKEGIRGRMRYEKFNDDEIQLLRSAISEYRQKYNPYNQTSGDTNLDSLYKLLNDLLSELNQECEMIKWRNEMKKPRCECCKQVLKK